MSLAHVAWVAALGQLDRKGVAQTLLSRPIVIGWVLGLMAGRPLEGLLLAAPFELFWSGDVNVGAFMPDNEVVGTCSVVGAVLLVEAPIPLPVLAVLSLSLLPLARVMRGVDARFQVFNNKALARARAGTRDPLPAALAGLVLPTLLAAVVSTAAAFLGARLLTWLGPMVPEAYEVVFQTLWLAAGVAGTSVAVARVRETWTMRAAAIGATLAIALLALGRVP